MQRRHSSLEFVNAAGDAVIRYSGPDEYVVADILHKFARLDDGGFGFIARRIASGHVGGYTHERAHGVEPVAAVVNQRWAARFPELYK